MTDPHTLVRRLKFRGHADDTVENTLTQACNLTADQARQLLAEFHAHLADEGSKLDVLAALTLNFHQREVVLEDLLPNLKKPEVTASSFSAARNLLNDQKSLALAIHQFRKDTDRDRCVPAEQAAALAEEQRKQDERDWAAMALLRDRGHYYVPGVDLDQPESCLDPEIVALRDAVRMRHLPKSPYEDRILADYYGATFDCEKDVDPDSLPKQEIPCDEFQRDPTTPPNFRHSFHGETQAELLARLTAERIRAYRDARDRAETRIDEVDRVKGSFRPCPACRAQADPPVWVDETPAMKKVSQWKGPFGNVIVAALLFALALTGTLHPVRAGDVSPPSTTLQLTCIPRTHAAPTAKHPSPAPPNNPHSVTPLTSATDNAARHALHPPYFFALFPTIPPPASG